MIKGKRGNAFFGFSIAIFIWIMGIIFLPYITDDVTTTRTELDCGNSSISDGTKLNCLGMDIVVPYFIWFLIGAAIGFAIGGIS